MYGPEYESWRERDALEKSARDKLTDDEWSAVKAAAEREREVEARTLDMQRAMLNTSNSLVSPGSMNLSNSLGIWPFR